jgi:ketosteroid isomerase-like protein
MNNSNLSGSDIDAIESLSDARAKAILNRDRAGVLTVHHEEFVYVHSSGKNEEFQSYVNTILTGDNIFSIFEQTARKTVVFGTVAHVTGNLRIKSTRFDSKYHASELWVNDGDGWKLRYHQNTKIS